MTELDIVDPYQLKSLDDISSVYEKLSLDEVRYNSNYNLSCFYTLLSF